MFTTKGNESPTKGIGQMLREYRKDVAELSQQALANRNSDLGQEEISKMERTGKIENSQRKALDKAFGTPDWRTEHLARSQGIPPDFRLGASDTTGPNPEIAKRRDLIDSIDEDIVSLLGRRQQIVSELMEHKRGGARDEDREAQKRARLRKLAEKQELSQMVVDVLLAVLTGDSVNVRNS